MFFDDLTYCLAAQGRNGPDCRPFLLVRGSARVDMCSETVSDFSSGLISALIERFAVSVWRWVSHRARCLYSFGENSRNSGEAQGRVSHVAVKLAVMSYYNGEKEETGGGCQIWRDACLFCFAFFVSFYFVLVGAQGRRFS